MKKEIIEKITKNRSPLMISDISPEEKKRLLDFLGSRGFTITTFYLRFFQKGFFPWESLGVNECKKRFLELPEISQALLEFVNPDDENFLEGDRGYYYTLAMSDEPGVFYDTLTKARLCMKFSDYMGNLGMSATTVRKRFTENDWKQWEKDGMKATLTEFSNIK